MTNPYADGEEPLEDTREEDQEWQAVRLLGKGASADKVDLEQLDKRADRYEDRFYGEVY